MSDIVFLTGATGLVGQYLVSKIMQADNNTSLVLLIRGDSDSEVENRLDKVLSPLSSSIDPDQVQKRIKTIRGDITLNQFGISGAAYNDLASKVTHIVHSAASVKFHLSLEQARAVNVIGTKEVTALARLAQTRGQLKHFAFISTAYVSGERRGLIKEDELDRGQHFSNTYEQTKLESEKFILRFSDTLPTTIFRPSIIAGDSKTGLTPSFNGLYTPLKFISRGLVKYLPGLHNTALDVVPVDFVCDALFHILFRSEDSAGRIYHLAYGKNNRTTVGEIADLAVDYFNQTSKQRQIPRVKFISRESSRAEGKLLNHREKRTLEALKAYVPYFELNKSFDTTNTRAKLQGTNITSPPFKKYYKTILQYCFLTNWGKRDINVTAPPLDH